MLRGDWLWSGKGMIEAQMPRIMDGWISQWVYMCRTPPAVEFIRWPTSSSMVMAIIVVSSSSVSTYSMHPVATKSFQV